MGISGMHKFFETHRCNSICRLIGLPPHQTKQVDYGTVVPSFNAGRALSGGQLQVLFTFRAFRFIQQYSMSCASFRKLFQGKGGAHSIHTSPARASIGAGGFWCVR